MAHAPLLRTNTAPIFQQSVAGGARHHATMSVSSAPRTSQLSGSTVFNSNSSLESLGSAVTMVAPMNGQVVANNNIINQTADASRSLYQKCMALQRRLALVPGFEGYMQELEEMTSNPDLGPVGALWKLLRTGLPLLAIYNALQPPVPLSIDVRPGDSDAKKAKIAIMKFVTECKGILSTSECFIVNDVLGEDTTGFVKVRRCRLLALGFDHTDAECLG